MSTVIIFPDNDDWFKANWVARRLFQDVRERYHLNAEDEYELEQGLAFNGLSLPRMHPEMRSRIMRMLKATSIDLVNDKSNKYIGDFNAEQYLQYKNALPSLIDLIGKYENADWPPPKVRNTQH
jgi:hypothetical protein